MPQTYRLTLSSGLLSKAPFMPDARDLFWDEDWAKCSCINREVTNWEGKIPGSGRSVLALFRPTPQASLSGTLPPSSAVLGYAAEGAFLPPCAYFPEIAPKSHAVSGIRKICEVWVLRQAESTKRRSTRINIRHIRQTALVLFVQA